MNENKIVTIQARYSFTDAEIRQIALKMAERASEYTQVEAELASIRADFKAKLERLELDRDNLTQKIRDGFEMRPVQAVVSFNDPSPGRKTYRYPANPPSALGGSVNLSGGCVIESRGAVIREEAMDATDYQRDLPLDERPPETATEVLCDYHSSTYGACQLPLGHDGDHAFDGHALDRHPELGDNEKERQEARATVEHAAQPIGTSIADKLAQAASGVVLSPVVIDYSDKDGWNKCLARWRKAARSQGWPEACVDLINEVCMTASEGDQKGTKGRVLEVLAAHSVHTWAYEALHESQKLAATFSTTEEGA